MSACTRCGSESRIVAPVDDPAVIRRIPSHLVSWRERKGNERGAAPLEPGQSDADLVYESVDALSSCLSACGHAQAGDYAQTGGCPGYEGSPYKHH
jgi:hypothetical protein